MSIPHHVQVLVDQALAGVLHEPKHTLLPFRRLVLYDAFGPTFASATYEERFQILQRDQLPLTRADRIRARLAIITAQRVLPLWYSAREEAGLLTPARIEAEVRDLLKEMVRLYVASESQPALAAQRASSLVDYSQLRTQLVTLEPHQLDPTKQAVMQECVTAGLLASSASPSAVVRVPIESRLAEHRSVYLMPITELPVHNLQLAEGVLSGVVAPSNALSQSGGTQDCFGNFLGYEEEEFPARAYDVGMATYEALKQALGLGPFDRQEITLTTTNAWLMGEGAAAAALKAYSGVFEGNISTKLSDHEKQLEFWLWWLTEAIPQTWAAEPDQADPPGLATMPFTATVRVTKYPTGVTSKFNDPSFDQ